MSDWRPSVFGGRLVRPATSVDHPIEFCSVDVLSQEEHCFVGVYFRNFLDRDDSSFRSVIELHRRLAGRLEVVQVFLPPWIGFQHRADLTQLFTRAYVGAPWFTMPINDQVKWVRMKHRFRGKGGMLVLLSAQTGKVILKDASYQLKEDPKHMNLSWVPRQYTQILAEATQKGLISGGLRKGQKINPFSSLDGFIKALYFSAHWCPPCRVFTPQLIQCYHNVRARGHKFEVIFISSDRSEESYENYLSTMPWTALPYNSNSVQELASALEVHGIPSLILLESDNSLITDEARTEVKEDPEGKCFPWRRRLVNVLSDRLTDLLYDSPAIVLFVDGEEPEDFEFAETVLLPAAEWARSLELDYQLLFYIAIENDASERLRAFTKLEDVCPLVTAVDFPLNRFCVMELGVEITIESVKMFASNFISDKLNYKPISETVPTDN